MAQIEPIDGIPVELTEAQEQAWARGASGRSKVRKQVRKARKQWHKENLDGLDDEPASDYDSLVGDDS